MARGSEGVKIWRISHHIASLYIFIMMEHGFGLISKGPKMALPITCGALMCIFASCNVQFSLRTTKLWPNASPFLMLINWRVKYSSELEC